MFSPHYMRIARVLVMILWIGPFVLRSGADTTGEPGGMLDASGGPPFGNSVYNPTQVDVAELGGCVLWNTENPRPESQPQEPD